MAPPSVSDRSVACGKGSGVEKARTARKLRALAEVVLPFSPWAPVGAALGKIDKLTASEKDLDVFIRQAESFLAKTHPGSHPDTITRRDRTLEAALQCARRLGEHRFRALAARGEPTYPTPSPPRFGTP